MKIHHLVAVAAIAFTFVGSTDQARAQDGGRSVAAPDRPVLSTEFSESAQRAFPSAAELRQARALYQTQQRVERLERNAWLGYEPLRPGFAAVPMMTSRHVHRRVISIPVFYYTR